MPTGEHVYKFGEWEIDLSRRELRGRGARVPIGGRAFEIIELLVQSAGELVTKNELMDRLWPSATVGDHTLHVHISAVRKALGPDRGMLKMVSNRGYRLLGDWAISQLGASLDPDELKFAQIRAEPFGSNLPAATSALIGRVGAAQHLCQLLSAYRAVTLTGTGGIGKTVLAIDVARNLFQSVYDSVYFVELLKLQDATLVPFAVANVLSLRFGGEEISAEFCRSGSGRAEAPSSS